jgi:hypothetical protein
MMNRWAKAGNGSTQHLLSRFWKRELAGIKIRRGPGRQDGRILGVCGFGIGPANARGDWCAALVLHTMGSVRRIAPGDGLEAWQARIGAD